MESMGRAVAIPMRKGGREVRSDSPRRETRSAESKGRDAEWPRQVWMRYVLAILVPPLAVIKCHKPRQVALNIFLTLLFWIPGAAHAALMVFDHQEEQRAQDVSDAIQKWTKQASV